jgi:hypothetical protein
MTPAAPAAEAGAPAALYLRFVGIAAGTGVALAVLGYAATRRWGGEGAVAAMVVACAVSVAASAAGALPVVFGRGTSPAERLNRTLGAMLARLVVALAGGAAVALGGWVPARPLIIWLAISYLVLLVVDTAYALRVLRGPEESERR